MERRKSRRKAVEGLDEIMVSPQVPGGSPLPVLCRIRDLSPHGMRLFVQGTAERAGIELGQSLSVTECPDLLAPLLTERGLKVVWIKGLSCGVRFDAPLRCALDEWDAGAEFVAF